MNQILIADDDKSILSALKLLLVSEGFEVVIASNPEQVKRLCSERKLSAALIDLNYSADTTSGQEGLELITSLSQQNNGLPVIAMTGWATVDLAVEAMKNGAKDFIQKPWDNDRLLHTLNTQISLANHIEKAQRLTRYNEILKENSASDGIIAESSEMQTLLTTARQVAASDINVVITGENGTGKSLLAEFIHENSPRNQQELISVNMGAIAENLFESEMFGHVKGAFTDAKESRIGRFELADGGSLFLDEIGNIPLSQQSKLLRVLENQQFERLGNSKTIQVDARVISATNANIEQMLADNLFRHDLYYRLCGVEIQIPALRERVGDILPIAEKHLELVARKYNKTNISFDTSAKSAMLAYEWPGNIRELKHQVERAVILSNQSSIGEKEILPGVSSKINTTTANDKKDDFYYEASLEEIERDIIEQRIAQFNGNMVSTAKSLGLSRSAFYRRLEKYK